jgi:hypothetical protein
MRPTRGARCQYGPPTATLQGLHDHTGTTSYDARLMLVGHNLRKGFMEAAERVLVVPHLRDLKLLLVALKSSSSSPRGEVSQVTSTRSAAIASRAASLELAKR